MTTFQLLPGARGLDLAGGGSLSADKHGRVTVDDATARAIRSSSAMRRYDALVEVAPGRYGTLPTERTCGCGFAPWRWQSVCPRCGADMTEAS